MLDKIIKGCQKGKLKYQQQLYELYAGKMKFVCLRYLIHDSDAEDAIQESFIKLFNAIPKYQEKGYFEAWMRKIFINTSLAMLKKKKKEKLVNTDFRFHQDEYEEYEFDEGIESSEIDKETVNFFIVDKADFSKEELMESILELSENYRTVFNLYFLEQYKHIEISELLGIDEKTSRSRLSRARKKIQESLYSKSIKKLAID